MIALMLVAYAFNYRTASSMNPNRISSLDTPSYSAPDAARILAVPLSTVRDWSLGRKLRFPSVIEPADRSNRLLSFANLCELHVLSAIRREHRVTLPVVRKSVNYVRKKMGKRRPLLDVEFSTNGVSLFVEHASELLDVGHEGQLAMRGEFERALSRIKRDRSGTPVRLFPYSRARQTSERQPELIAVDPAIAFGRPMLVGAGVKTEVIASRFRAGDTPAGMALDYEVSEPDILEALRYEQRWAQAA